MDTPTDKSQIGGNKLRDIAAQLETSRGKTAQDISDDQDLLTTMGLTCRTAAKKPEDMKPPVKTPSHKTQAALMETLSASSILTEKMKSIWPTKAAQYSRHLFGRTSTA